MKKLATQLLTTTALWIFVAIISSVSAQDVFSVVREFKVPEAHQAVAVDKDHFYAIATKSIGKYQKKSGKFVKKWQPQQGNREIIHLNSGLIVAGKLYCAHSNWPQIPMKSSIEIWDSKTLLHIGNHNFANPPGSCTWIDKYQGKWWVCFAHYDKKGVPGKGVEMTQLVEYDDQWRRLRSFFFPKQVILKFKPYSCSGGLWGFDDFLYVSGHDRPEIYALKLTKDSSLELMKTLRVNSQGQGIAIDRKERHLYTIKRKERLVVISQINTRRNKREK